MVDQVADATRRVQYEVTPSQVNFTYNFAINEATDLKVYLRGPTILPDDSTQIIILNVDYTVTGVGLSGGGLVVTTVAPTTGFILTIDGDQPIERLDVIGQGNTFNSTLFNKDLDNQTIFAQQLETVSSTRTPSYETSAIITEGDLSLPVLGDQEIWKGTPTGISAATFEEASGFSTLRSDLASQANGADGALIVGYFDAVLGGTTVKNKLDNFSSQADGLDGALRVGYFDPINGATTVNAKLSSISTAPSDLNYTPAGNFDLNPFQRGTTFGPLGPGGSQKTADRFIYSSLGAPVATYTVEKVTDAPTVSEATHFSQFSLRNIVNTPETTIDSNSFIAMITVVEGFDWVSLFQIKFHVSFWVKANPAGVYSCSLRNGGSDKSFVHEYTINTADTWQFITFPVSESPSAGSWFLGNGAGISLVFNLNAGLSFVTTGGNLDTWIDGNFIAGPNTINNSALAANSFIINSVQIMAGHVVIPFQPSRIEEVLTHCQRYYEKSYLQGVNPGAITTVGLSCGAAFASQDIFSLTRTFTTIKRLSPTMSWYSPSSGNIANVLNLSTSIDEAVVSVSFVSDSSTGCPNKTPVNDIAYGGQWTAESEF